MPSTRYRIPFVIASGILVAVGVANHSALQGVNEATDQRMKAREVLVQLQSLFSTLQDAETGQRGFLISGDSEFLVPYRAATQRIDRQLSQLKSAEQRATFQPLPADLDELIAKKMRFLAETIQLAEAKGLAAARDRVSAREGLRTMDEIRHLIRKQTDWVNEVVARRAVEARRAAELTSTISGFGAISALSILGIAFFLLHREALARQVATDALEKANTALEKRMAEESAALTATRFSLVEEQSERAELAEGLEAVHERLRLAVEAAGIGMFDWNLTTDRIVWTREHERIWGVRPGEFDGTYAHFEQSVHPADLPIINAEVKRCIATRERFEQEFRLIWPDGSSHWVLGIGEFKYNPYGRAVRMLGAVLDTTARKRMEVALQEREHRLAESQRIGHIGSWTYDLDGHITWSDETYRIFGLSPPRFDERIETFLALIHPEDRAAMQQWCEDCLAGQQPADLLFRRVLPNGRVRYLNGRGELRMDAEGQVLGMAGTVQDVTEFREMTEALLVEKTGRAELAADLSRVQERLRLLESLPLPLLVVNATGTITLVNPHAEQLLGYPHDELLGQPVEVLIPEALRARHRDDRSGYQRRPEPRPMGKLLDIRARRKDGKELPVEIMLAPIQSDAETAVIVGIVDIREQKRVQDSLAATLKEKTVLLHEVHHRVKNNLAIISSLLSLQSQRATHLATREALEESQQRIKAIALIHQLLYESKDVAKLPFDQYLGRLIRLLGHLTKADTAKIDCQVKAEPLSLALSQAIPCALLINELVTNAYKHAFPDGRGGRITIGLQHCAEGEALLIVEDDGVGLPAERWLQDGGSLGMQLIGALAEQAHGRITRVPGPGTRIEFRFNIQGEPPL